MSRIKNLIDQKFGRLKVINFSHINKFGSAVWKCHCDCGNSTLAHSNQMKSGQKTSCGCNRKIVAESKYCYKYGKYFGRLLALYIDDVKKHKTYWRCQCSCGKEVTVASCNLKNDNTGTRSCGCLRNTATHNSTINNVYTAYKSLCKKKKRKFKLTFSEFLNLTLKSCHYCGTSYSNTIKRKSIIVNYNGIDRKNPKLGYIKNNCVPCCRQCNLSKWDMDFNEFIDHIKKIYKYQKKRIKSNSDAK